MSRARVRTLRPDGTGSRYLGTLGTISGLRYSFTLPGGCDALSCTLGIPPNYRTDAMDPGRLVHVLLGGSVVWEGILDEPQPDPEFGWTITAHGSGTWGSQYTAVYNQGSVAWSAAVPDTVINNAIGRGLGWLTSAVGTPTGIWLGQHDDSGMAMIDQVLNEVTSHGGLTWQIKRTANGNQVQMPALATTPNRLLVADDPAGRTLGGDVNAICIRYVSTPDLGSGFPAIYSTVFAVDQPSIDKHGRMEVPLDLSSAGAMLSTDAQAVGNFVLQRYQRAQFAGPFTVRYGQLLTIGGQPADLGVYWAGQDQMVCRLILADQGWGGEVVPGLVKFLVGRYEYDDDTDTATIEPFNSLRTDFQGRLDLRASQAHGRRVSVSRGGHGNLIWWFGRYAKSWKDIHTRHQRGYHPHRRPHGPGIRGGGGSGGAG